MEEIKNLLLRDQEIIKLFKNNQITSEEFKDRANKISDRFFEIYKKYNFPNKKDFSEEIYKGAVVLTLHQPPEQLENIYNDIKNHSSECVDRADLAYMSDKIRIHKNQKQIYGTQYKIENGKIVFLPIENMDEVDHKRKLAGMESFQEYKKRAERGL